MTREEFLKGLEEALAGEVPAAVIRENLNYYGSYIAQEMAKGRTMEEIVQETGGPRIVAQTIIDSSEAAGEGGAYGQSGYGNGGYGAGDGYGSGQGGSRGYGTGQSGKIHYFDLNKWYWRILLPLIVIGVVLFFLYAVGGIFYLLVRFAGPLLLILFVIQIFKNMRR